MAVHVIPFHAFRFNLPVFILILPPIVNVLADEHRILQPLVPLIHLPDEIQPPLGEELHDESPSQIEGGIAEFRAVSFIPFCPHQPEFRKGILFESIVAIFCQEIRQGYGSAVGFGHDRFPPGKQFHVRTHHILSEIPFPPPVHIRNQFMPSPEDLPVFLRFGGLLQFPAFFYLKFLHLLVIPEPDNHRFLLYNDIGLFPMEDLFAQGVLDGTDDSL